MGVMQKLAIYFTICYFRTKNNKVIKELKKMHYYKKKKITNYYTKGFYNSTKVLTINSRNIIIFKIVFLDSDFGSPEKNLY